MAVVNEIIIETFATTEEDHMMPELFIKGYKIDRVKLQQTYGNRPDDPQNTRFLPIWEHSPLPFKYLASIEEENADLTLVMVLEDGYDRKSLEGKDIPLLGGVYESVFTSGVWVRR
ncbi:hypothetical protein EDB85DRAFT_1885056 [Lactarius pseudohatsudake]|nr:hypothetical protein EDB85DRAFT_1885056 [Lactarius pseudohatsudake]